MVVFVPPVGTVASDASDAAGRMSHAAGSALLIQNRRLTRQWGWSGSYPLLVRGGGCGRVRGVSSSVGKIARARKKKRPGTSG